MNENTITIVAILISVLVVFVVYKHIELTVQIRDIVKYKAISIQRIYF